jgi:cell wall-associated NlpC family hydrolase
MNKYLVVFTCAMLMAACSSAPHYGSSKSAVNVSSPRVDLGDSAKVQQILNQQYEDWRDVPHRMGGTSRAGIDCSGLVYKTYRSKLGVDMPRSTEYQSKVGRGIPKEQLRAGDLVFFKTGVFTRHVGMYIDKGDFLHVSSSNGVMISNLEQRYWNRAYWKARRIQ